MKNGYIYLFLLILFACSKPMDHSSPANFTLQYSEQTNIDYLKELIDRRPRNAGNYIRLANIYMQNDDSKKAIAILNSGKEEDPENKELDYLLIKAYLNIGQRDLAQSLFDRLNLSPEGMDDFVLSAEYYFHNGEYTKALDNINRVLVLDDGNSDFYATKAKILLKIQDTVGALNNYEIAIQKNNIAFNTTIEYLDLLVARHMEDKFKDVYAVLPERIKKQPGCIFAVADLLVARNELDSAKEMVLLVHGDETDKQKTNKLVKINFKQGNYDSVLYYLSDYQLESADMLLYEARSNDRLRQYQEAEQSYLTILERDSTHAIANDELVKLRRKMRYLRDLRKRQENRIEIIQNKPLIPNN